MKTETATFAAGCFWGVEELYRTTPGVLSTQVGYTGGRMKNPSYQDVCTDETGHAEAVQITFDPKKVSYEALLDVFWRAHDPTQVNRQGLNFGNHYRSVIGYHSEKQRKVAEASKKKEQKRFDKPIATAIQKAGAFYPAEEYHQKFFMKRNVKFTGVC
ncbi:peptide-methionine (S)-S-oxide reductase MsrA [Candidatus Micrarchaeota archaeon]|nr:peptide-methionine (S)-S-oxide reductase MsrA [Candidatus Micrarchaeota archaeon]